MNKISTIIFDWHGVLDFITFESFTHKLAALTGLSKESIKEKIHTYERSYAAGLLETKDFWELVKDTFLLSEESLETLKKFILSYRENTELWSLIPQLQKTYTLAILSDCPKDKLAIIKQSADLNCFSSTHFSCDKHILKNDNNFFLDLIKELGVSAANCLYVDDSKKHIETAQQLGFHTCLFSSTTDLVNRLS